MPVDYSRAIYEILSFWNSNFDREKVKFSGKMFNGSPERVSSTPERQKGIEPSAFSLGS